MNSTYQELLDLAAGWGFVEPAELRPVHARIVDSLSVGAPIAELWTRYELVTDPLVDFPEGGLRTSRARAGRQIVRGLIWIEAGEIVTGLSNIMVAEALARNAGWAPDEALLADFMRSQGSAAERIQAEAYFLEDAQDWLMVIERFEAALALYRDDDEGSSLTDQERGLLHLHIAECYLGLLRWNSEGTSWLQQQVVGTLESAASYLVGTLEFERVQSLIDRTSQEDWWIAAVERQQADPE